MVYWKFTNSRIHKTRLRYRSNRMVVILFFLTSLFSAFSLMGVEEFHPIIFYLWMIGNQISLAGVNQQKIDPWPLSIGILAIIALLKSIDALIKSEHLFILWFFLYVTLSLANIVYAHWKKEHVKIV